MAKRLTIHQKASFLGDAVFAASDGIITTFAIVAGAAGASLDSGVVLVLGFANLFADGISMAAGNYLGVKSEIEFEQAEGKGDEHEGSPIKHGAVTLVSFSFAGLVPIIPFIFNVQSTFIASALLVGVAMFLIGFLKSLYTKKSFIKSGMEMLVIGGFAAFAAFTIGFLIEHYVL